MESIIHIQNIHKHFGHVYALRGVSLDVNKGEVVVIIGPSGSGKSTLLRCINRLVEYDAGQIVVDGIPLDSAENINAVRREVGMVFQSFNLFAHLTVLDNITLAQRVVRGRKGCARLTPIDAAHRKGEKNGGDRDAQANANGTAHNEPSVG